MTESTAANAGLGARVGHYRYRQSWFPLIFAVFFGSFALLGLVGVPIWLVGVFLLLAVAGVVPFTKGQLAGRDRGLDLFEHGVIVTNAAKQSVFHYDTMLAKSDVVRYVGGSTPSYTMQTYTLIDLDKRQVLGINGGSALVGSGYERPTEWGPIILREIASAQLPASRSKIAAGERVEFGSVWLSAQEIGDGRTSWRWADVSAVRVNNNIDKGNVELFTHGRQKPETIASVRSILNFAVFITLAEELSARRRSG